MISDDPYRTSTQYRLFSYASPHELLAQRTKTNARSRSQLPPETSYLSVSEEVELVDYYVTKLWGLCRLFNAPSHVRATATSFLLRYYLHNTPLTTHPKHLILTALFLAAKTENAFIPLEYFKNQLPANIDSSQLTSLEFPLSQGLQFSYTVWSCLRPLWGFGLQILELVNVGALDFDKDDIHKMMDDARQWGSESLRTDAQFLFTPPQIALACIFHHNKELVRKLLSIKFPPGRLLSPIKSENGKVDPMDDMNQEDAATKLMEAVVACDMLISERLGVIHARNKEETVKLATEIDKKLYRCKKVLDAVESPADTAKRKASSPEGNRDLKKPKAE